MKVRCQNDDINGRGYACFICSEVSGASANYFFSLCRATDQTFLGKSGWQNAEERHAPDRQDVYGSGVTLHVGPSIVNALDDNENYRLTIYAEGQPNQGAVFSITNINRSLRESSGAVSAAAKATSAPPEQELTDPEPIAPAPVPREELLPDSKSTSPEKTSRKPLMAVAALLVLALIGGGAWFALYKPADEQAKSGDAKKIEEQTAKDEKTPPAVETPPVETTRAAPPSKAESVKLSVRDQVRQYLGGTPTTQGAMELSKTLADSAEKSAPETQDSVYRLLYYASQNGDMDAKLQLAKIADPCTPQWGTLHKNAADAWRYYASVALQKQEAAQAMQDLKKWLEDEHAKGNAEARAWIEEIARDSGAK